MNFDAKEGKVLIGKVKLSKIEADSVQGSFVLL